MLCPSGASRINPNHLVFRAHSTCTNWAMNVLKRTMNAIGVELRSVPLIARWVIVGAASASVIGGISGLFVGLSAYAPTAWFAVFELGVPAGVAGGFIGLVAAMILTIGNRIKRHIMSRSRNRSSPTER
jgi:hypothetical protein